MAGSLIAMDEQKRDADGKFGSGGGSSGGGKYDKAPAKAAAAQRYMEAHGLTDSPATRKELADVLGLTSKEVDTFSRHGRLMPVSPETRSKGVAPVAKDSAYNMSGEAGRQARKLARDCMSGRFRP